MRSETASARPVAARSGRYRAVRALLAIAIVYGSLFPFNYVAPASLPEAWRAFWSNTRLFTSIGDVLGNVALFVPWGFAAVVLVAAPFLRGGVQDDRLDIPSEDQDRRLAIIEERDHALAALKELEFDHRTGKISDEDYRSLVGGLRREVADALRALDVGKTNADVGGRNQLNHLDHLP